MAGKSVEGFPIYRDVARRLVGRIEGGDLLAGNRVPSERELASDSGVHEG